MYQSFARINNSIEDGSFFKIPAFMDAITHCKKNKKSLHLISLLQTQ
jgi:2,3-bisphosphoglycerate-independent phosphoglycerate mutase